MGVFNKWGGQQKNQAPPWPVYDSGSPESSMTEMSPYSNSSREQSSRASRPSTEKFRSSPERVRSSAASFMTHTSSASVTTSYMSSRKAEKGWVHDINKHQLMAKHLYRNCRKNNWIEGKTNEACVALRSFQGDYVVYPQSDPGGVYETAIQGLNVEVFTPQFVY